MNLSFLYPIFHKFDYCFKKELKDCKTVLDLGCGPSSPLQYVPWITSSVGVEIYKPYLEQSKKNKIHTKYLHQKIDKVNFPKKSFDAVILVEVIEHLPQKKGLEIIKKAEKWARKKVIISSPNGFISQQIVDNNPFQRHLSGWDYQKMLTLGYKIRGLAGLKILRREAETDTMGDDMLVSIRFKPKKFWFIIASLSQLFCYYFPPLAFELFSVKKVNTK